MPWPGTRMAVEEHMAALEEAKRRRAERLMREYAAKVAAMKPSKPKRRRKPERWTGTHAEYMASARWARKRAAAFKFHGRKCAQCGSTDHLQVHHLTYHRIGREKMKDLQVLCDNCHAFVHGKESIHDPLTVEFRSIIG